MKKHANIPIFIPHEGCNNACVFCNQRKITGKSLSANRDIRPEIESVLSTINPENYDIEIAFFGGSFTGIDRKLMIRLLSDAYEFVECGKVSSIRLSTRPDYIDDGILQILKSYGVRNIELGIQSMSENVLLASKRGHTVSDSIKACKLVKSYGFSLVCQMMIGLPASTLLDELNTADRIIELKADGARIYPTVVFYDTELCSMAENGSYKPLTNEEAVERSARVYEKFIASDIKVLRIGLQASENLSDEKEVYAGANHSALGELVENEIYRAIIVEKADILTKAVGESGKKNGELMIYCGIGETSKLSGQGKKNKKLLFEYFSKKGLPLSKIKILESEKLSPHGIKMEFSKNK